MEGRERDDIMNSTGDTYYRQLCETLGSALMATDANLRIRVWNAVASRMFGASESLMLGQSVISVFPQAVRSRVAPLLEDAVNSGDTHRFEFEHRDAKGSQRELAGTIAPVVSQDGDRIGVSICFRDITRRIELQQDLDESRKMVSLGEMAGAVAHHFNNILGGVVTSIDFARAQQNPLVDRRVLEQVGDALGKATSLINGLLAFSEGDTRRGDLSDLTEVLYDLADDTEVRLRDSQIELKIDYAELPVIAVNRMAVSTTLSNIVQNAIEAMPNGGTLTIATTSHDDAVHITIADTGAGFEEAVRARIFEPFWTTKGVLGYGGHGGGSGGVGLGLAIAHGLAQMVGASIVADSKPGAGSTFTLRIPFKRDE